MDIIYYTRTFQQKLIYLIIIDIRTYQDERT